jgi:hypothetical protein
VAEEYITPEAGQRLVRSLTEQVMQVNLTDEDFEKKSRPEAA